MAIRRKTVRRKITMPHHPTSFMPSQEVLLRDGLIPHADSMFQRFLIDFDESGFASSLRGLEHDELTDTHSAESFRPKAHFAREDLVVSDRYGYSAFGEMASRTPSTGGTANPFLFNAQQFDVASGDYYLRARYYDQSNGRFISQDPYGGDSQDPVSLHRYLYANVDPLNYVDPSGQDGELVDVAFSMAMSAEVGGVLSYAAVRASGGDGKTSLKAAFYGGAAGLSLAYAYGNGRIGITVLTGILGAITVLTLDALVSPTEFHKKGHPAEDVIEGFATAATTTAFSDGLNVGLQGTLAGGLTLAQDTIDALADCYSPGKPFEQGKFWKKMGLGLCDSAAAGIIAMGAGASTGTQFGGKVVKEAKQLTQGKTDEEVSEKVVACVFAEFQYIASGIVKVFDAQGGSESPKAGGD